MPRNPFLLMTLAICAVTALGAGAAQEPGPGSFRYERPIVIARPGPQRLPVDVPLLSGASRFRISGSRAYDGLADLRLFDGSGAPVPYLLVHAPRVEPQWRGATLLPVADRVSETTRTSGFEADLGSIQPVDAISVTGVPAPFLKRFVLEGSGDRVRWTMLIREGTLFDLPQESLRQTDVHFLAGEYRYLRVTWDDANSGRVPLPSGVRARLAKGQAAAPPLSAPLTLERRPSEPGRSRYRVRLPAAGLPIVAIRLDVPGQHVFRTAAVQESRFEGGEAAPVELGRASLRQALRDGVTGGDLRIAIAAPTEPELDVVVEDGSNPPLDVRGATAILAELPWIYLESPGAEVIARYGVRQPRAPSYDLEALRPTLDIGTVPEATWGAVRVLEGTEPPAPSVPLPGSGAALDPSGFEFSRDIARSAAGLAALPLDAAVLAGSRGPSGRFADVRIVDQSGRQVPYLIERRDEPLPMTLPMRKVDVPASAGTPAGHRSAYEITLPHANLPPARLVLETPARVFQRQVKVVIRRPPDRRQRDEWLDVRAESRWTHADQHTPAPALALPLGAAADTALLLIVEEGDNAPLPIAGARLLLPSYRLRFYYPEAAALRLVYGRRDVPAPQYDLALLAPQVMGSEAREVTAAAASSSRASEPLPEDALISPRVFWGFLVATVLCLLVLIARLVKGQST